jgi:hypothetical protein
MAVELRAAAALAGSGAGGPNESHADPRLPLPPLVALQLQLRGGVWCAEWSRWVECSSTITSINCAANGGPPPCSSSSSGHRGAAVPCVRADGCGGRRKWMGKRTSGGERLCGGADRDKAVVGPLLVRRHLRRPTRDARPDARTRALPLHNTPETVSSMMLPPTSNLFY